MLYYFISIYINIYFIILGLFKNGTVIKDLKTLFENNNYLKLITSKLGNSIKDLEKVIQASFKLLNLKIMVTKIFFLGNIRRIVQFTGILYITFMV